MKIERALFSSRHRGKESDSEREREREKRRVRDIEEMGAS